VGIYAEYLDSNLDFVTLTAERHNQLQRISDLRDGRDVLVYAADLNAGQNKGQALNPALLYINYSDLLPISDQLSNLQGKKLDLILETPGGYAEVAEDIVRLLRSKYDDIAVIIPGWAKSAGTILAMAADEILMESVSGLGPIDAQLTWQGKVFSAEAFLEMINKIKEETVTTGSLNRAYIPILQNISPGEIQSAQNALDFAKVLVVDWLVKYKFRNWGTHSSTGQPVTEQGRKDRATEIAEKLCNHQRWLTHGRSIKIEDLRGMRLLITDYSERPELADAIRRYYTLLQMTFSSNAYKVFETPKSQIYRFVAQQITPSPAMPAQQTEIAERAFLNFKCGNCQQASKIQANLDRAQPLEPGCFPYPADNKFHCPNCGAEQDLTDARRQIELQSKKTIVT